MNFYTCDFETTTNPDDCRVWAAGIYDIYGQTFTCGKDIHWLMDKLTEGGNCKAYFHNLKFDGSFIISWLLKNGYKHTDEKKLRFKEFSTLISDKNQFYTIKVNYKGKIINFLDSLKIIPFSVKVIAKAFGLKIEKGEIDYHSERKPGHTITDEEYKYIKNDCQIVGDAIKTLFSQDLKAMTQGSNALKDFKKSLGGNFDTIFPKLDNALDKDLRASYRGGFTYVNPNWQGKTIGYGRVYDKNSMYPSHMKYSPMPYGAPVKYNGKYKEDKIYPLYIQKIRVIFDIKKNHIPTIQIKNGYGGFKPTEYVESSNDEEVILTLTNIDLELFKEQYTIHFIEYIEGWKFKAKTGIFDAYINKWYKIKEESTKNGNKGMRTLAKLMLNALYGKFATSTSVQSKIPYLEENIVKYKLTDAEEKDPVYLPVACYITAYSRAELIRLAQANYKRFAYCDTDSLHFEGREEPNGFEIDNYKLGAWSLETIFYKARFLRTKCYVELLPAGLKKASKRYRPYLKLRKLNTKLYQQRVLHVTVAGMPTACHKHVTLENFVFGAQYEGKLRFKTVENGAVLIDTPFNLKAS